MINRKLKKFIKILKSTKLSEKEKNLLRYRVSEFIAFNPIRGNTKVAKKSFYFSIFTFRTLSKTIALALILLVVVGGSGVTYASSSALPGDKLYQVKVNVNERIEEKLALTTEAKTQVHSTHVERRLNEARTLVQNQNLSPEKKEIVKTNLEKNVKSVTQSIESLKNEGKIEKALEMTSNISPVLETHKEILVKKNESKNNDIEGTSLSQELELETSVSVGSLIETIDIAIKQIEEVEETVIEKILDNQESLENLTSKNKEEVNNTINSIRASESQNTVETESEAVLETSTKSLEDKNSETVAVESSIEMKVLETNATDISAVTMTSAKLVAEPIIIKSEEDVESRIKKAEDLLIQAEIERVNKNYKEALVLSQKAKKIIRQIEIYRKIKAVETSAGAIHQTTEAQVTPQKDTVKKDEALLPATPENETMKPESETTENKLEAGLEIKKEEVKASIEITETDVIKSIEESNGLLRKINQANLEAQTRL